MEFLSTQPPMDPMLVVAFVVGSLQAPNFDFPSPPWLLYLSGSCIQLVVSLAGVLPVACLLTEYLFHLSCCITLSDRNEEIMKRLFHEHPDGSTREKTEAYSSRIDTPEKTAGTRG